LAVDPSSSRINSFLKIAVAVVAIAI